jgi:hypothetical protein
LIDPNPKTLKAQAEHLFTKKRPLLDLWQSIADNFYVERASFTTTRDPGEEFAAHLMSGYPIMARRDLGNAFGSMLRRDKWFRITTADEDIEKSDIEVKRWLEHARDRQYKMMYNPKAMFVRSTSEGDHDFAAFGQCAISIEVAEYSHLLYRCWHLKNLAWAENTSRQIDTVFLRHTMTCRDMCAKFKDVHPEVRTMMTKGREFEEIECLWAVYPDGEGRFWSVHMDTSHDQVLESVRMRYFPWVIPRWQTVSESQYAYSPAVVAALPDARLLQAMTITLLEAGELSVRPPLLAVQEAIRSDINLVSGGVTWVDAQYDERLGEVLRPLTQDRGGFPAAFRIEESVKFSIADAFYLNKLNLPITGDMTAYEVQQRVQEFIRQTLPLFSPVEQEYNAALCDRTFEVLMLFGAFRDMPIPEALQGQDVQFRFESPLQDATDREKAEQFRAMVAMVGEAAAVDQTVIQVPNFGEALRDAIGGLGAPATWVKSESETAEAVAAAQAQAEEDRAIAQAAEMAKMIPKGAVANA